MQHVWTDLTVAVYETHARVALEVGDMAEYTQCASCLRRLYWDGLEGNEPEFTAYRLLSATVQGAQGLSMELLALADRCQKTGNDLSEHKFVRHALDVARAVCGCNFHRFFVLYGQAPRMSAYLMDALLDSVRSSGLAALIASHGRDLDLDFVCSQLGFDCWDECAAFGWQRGAAIDLKRGILDPKASRAAPLCPRQ